MDEYKALDMYRLVPRADLPPGTKIMRTLRAYAIKRDEHGKFKKLNPRWCLDGSGMSHDQYDSFADVVRMSSIKLIACVKAAYPALIDIQADCSNAFQATRTDVPGREGAQLYCYQAPGFTELGSDGKPLLDVNGDPYVCEVLVALQGRIDAMAIYGRAMVRILVKVCGCERDEYDPELYIYESGLAGLTTLDSVMAAVPSMEGNKDEAGRPHGWAAIGRHVDDSIGVVTSVAVGEFIIGAINVEYACTYTGWRKVLGYTAVIDASDKSVTFSCYPVVEAAVREHFKDMPTYQPVHLYSAHVTQLERGQPPPVGSPDKAMWEQMRDANRRLLGLLIWVSEVYPQVKWIVGFLCGDAQYPTYDHYKHAKHVLLFLYHDAVPVRWGGHECRSLLLSDDSPMPFASAKREYGLHWFADGSPVAKSITGGVQMLAGGAYDSVSSRQHLTAPDSHTVEVVSAGSVYARSVVARGQLQKLRIPQASPTPAYVDSKSTIFVAERRASVRRSAWNARRSAVLQEGVELEECVFRHISEKDNVADDMSKAVTRKVRVRHMWYTHNLPGPCPP